LFITGQAKAAGSCQQITSPATADYDFTEALSRWGSKESYSMDEVAHHVRSISANRLPIFDENNPDEDSWLYRMANRLHVVTRPEVITDQLLFKEGDVVDSSMLAESERILRNSKFIGDARIRVLQDCETDVDLEMVTREVWTLTPELTFKSTGGNTSAGIGIRDTNILGTGQYVSLRYKHDQDRNTVGFVFNNPNINGSRIAWNSEFDTNTDGHHYLLDTGQPFYALDTPRAWDIQYQSDRAELSQYQYGERISQLVHDMHSMEVSGGIATRKHGSNIYRFGGGLHAETNDYVPGDTLPTPPEYRQNIDLNYPFVQFELVEDNYQQAFNLNQLHRTEDLYVGRRVVSRLGYDAGDDSALIFNGSYSDTLLYQPRRLLQFNASWDGRRQKNANQWQDSTLSANLDYYRGQTEKRILYLSLEANHAWNLNNGRQLELGGSNGLRGFDTHFLNGNGSVRFTIEERYYTDLHLFNLFRVGYAAYFDAGRVYGNPDPQADKVFKNIGLGLRLGPSRTQSGQIIHLDLAYPLDNSIPNGGGLQLVAQVKKSF
jgi:hypothetical protein